MLHQWRRLAQHQIDCGVLFFEEQVPAQLQRHPQPAEFLPVPSAQALGPALVAARPPTPHRQQEPRRPEPEGAAAARRLLPEDPEAERRPSPQVFLQHESAVWHLAPPEPAEFEGGAPADPHEVAQDLQQQIRPADEAQQGHRHVRHRAEPRRRQQERAQTVGGEGGDPQGEGIANQRRLHRPDGHPSPEKRLHHDVQPVERDPQHDQLRARGPQDVDRYYIAHAQHVPDRGDCGAEGGVRDNGQQR